MHLTTSTCKLSQLTYRSADRLTNRDAPGVVRRHYHFIGSYTSTGSGQAGGNFPAIEAATKHDMGVFIISPNDKGGMLYKPPQKFADATAPLSPVSRYMGSPLYSSILLPVGNNVWPEQLWWVGADGIPQSVAARVQADSYDGGWRRAAVW